MTSTIWTVENGRSRMIHTQDGLFFSLNDQNGRIRVAVTSDKQAPRRAGDILNIGQANVVFETELTADTFASAICAVSMNGDSYEHWRQALELLTKKDKK